jgi:hypothetical protein
MSTGKVQLFICYNSKLSGAPDSACRQFSSLAPPNAALPASDMRIFDASAVDPEDI